MPSLTHLSLKASNFKCFGEENQGFESIRPISLIIGKNNSGKSSLLDILEIVANPKERSKTPPLTRSASIQVTCAMTEDDIRKIYNDEIIIDNLNRRHRALPYVIEKVGTVLKWDVSPYKEANIATRFRLDNSRTIFEPAAYGLDNKLDIGAQFLIDPLVKMTLCRLSPDRDIRPEHHNTKFNIAPNGEGATAIIVAYINLSELPSSLIEKTLLSEINSVFYPDGVFTDIRAQQNADDTWEVYLEEDGKGRIPLSRSGSGLKTIILVMCMLHLIPAVNKKCPFRFLRFRI